MVRPERRVVPAGAGPARVSAGAHGSRFQGGGEIQPSRAECQEPLMERGGKRRAATTGEHNSLVKFSAERCLEGPSRSFHFEGNRQQPGPERMLDLSGFAGGGTQAQSKAEQERPSPAASSGKDRAYRAGRLKSRGAGRESERPAVPKEGVQDNAHGHVCGQSLRRWQYSARRATAHEAGSIHRRSVLRDGTAQTDGHCEIPGASHTRKIIVSRVPENGMHGLKGNLERTGISQHRAEPASVSCIAGCQEGLC